MVFIYYAFIVVFPAMYVKSTNSHCRQAIRTRIGIIDRLDFELVDNFHFRLQNEIEIYVAFT